MSKKIRIAFGRFMQETNSFSSVDTTREDFERTHYVEGEELLKICQKDEWEVKGFLKNLELSGFIRAVNDFKGESEIETVPLFSTWCISGGPLEKNFFNEICENLKKQLREAGELDGVFFALHGAMGVRDELDGETIFIKAIREVVGYDIPVVVTMDLHGLLTKEKVNEISYLSAYHTNPHWDMSRTGYRAGQILVKQLKEEVKPVTTWRTIPMLMGGGTTLDVLPPMRDVFRRIKELKKDPRVLDCSIFMVHPYLVHPDVGWSVYVITDNEPELAEKIADELAERCWAVRKKMPPKMLEPDEMLKQVREARIARKFGSIAVCDASDVVGAGGTGENTALLRILLEEASDLLCYYPLRSPNVIKEIWEKDEGSEVETTVGGFLQPEINFPVEVKGKLILKKESDNFGKIVLLDLGNVKLVLTEGYAMPMKPSFYEELGLNTMKADIVVVKNFFHFRIYYFLKSRKNLYVKTKGITDFDLFYTLETSYPCYPKDEVDDWKEIDRKKRGVYKEDEVIVPQRIPLRELKKNDHKKNILFILIIFLIGFLITRNKKK